MKKKIGNNKFKQIIEMAKKHKIASFLVIMVLMATSGLASWVLIFESSFTGQVVSNNEAYIVVSSDFSDVSLNVSHSYGEVESIMEVYNSNGETDMLVSTEINKADYPYDDCTLWEDDVEITLNFDNQTIEDGDTITIPSGVSSITATASAVRNACPQNFNVSVTLSN